MRKSCRWCSPRRPSAAASKAGDELVSIDGVPMHGHSLDDVSSRMRGTVGTDVRLTRRPRLGAIKPFSVESDA